MFIEVGILVFTGDGPFFIIYLHIYHF